MFSTRNSQSEPTEARSHEQRHRVLRMALLVPIIAFAVVSLYLWRYVEVYSAFPADDAFIFMRLARNVVERGQPYFNADQPVMAHSSHLWLLIVTFCFGVFGPEPASVGYAAWFFLATSVLLGTLLLRSARGVTVGLLVSSVAAVLFVGPPAATLMEAALATTCVTALFLAVEHDRPFVSGALSVACVLARYEFSIFLLILLLMSRDRGRFALGVFLSGVPAAAICFALYGTLIPATIAAKARVYKEGRWTLTQQFGFPWSNDSATPAWALALAGAVILIAFARAVAVRARGGRSWPITALAFSGVLFMAHWMAAGLMFYWYWPLLIVPVVLAIAASPRWWEALALACGLLLSVTPLVRNGYAAATGALSNNPRGFSELHANLRVRQYLLAGAWLRPQVGRGTLLTTEIGALGWALPEATILDGVGLASPQFQRFHPLQVPNERSHPLFGAIPLAAVRESTPDYIISLDSFDERFRRALASREISDYQRIRRIPAIPDADRASYGLPRVLWTSTWLNVYRRVVTNPVADEVRRDHEETGP